MSQGSHPHPRTCYCCHKGHTHILFVTWPKYHSPIQACTLFWLVTQTKDLQPTSTFLVFSAVADMVAWVFTNMGIEHHLLLEAPGSRQGAQCREIALKTFRMLGIPVAPGLERHIILPSTSGHQSKSFHMKVQVQTEDGVGQGVMLWEIASAAVLSTPGTCYCATHIHKINKEYRLSGNIS